MRHFSTLFSILALGLVIGMGTSCKKETASPANSNVTNTNFKVTQQDTTSTSQPYNDHGCGNGEHNGQGGYGY